MKTQIPQTYKRLLQVLLLVLLLQLPGISTHAQLAATTGKYVGNGQNGFQISGVGFKPDFLLIKCDLYYAQMTTSTLPANNTKDMNGGVPQSGLITSLDFDGFTVGNDVKINKSGTTYDYLAVKIDTGKFEIGSYIGTGSDDMNITGTSFKPDMVIIISEDNNEKPLYSSVTMGTDLSTNFLNSGFIADQVQAFNSNGFQVGKNKAVNVAGLRFHYIAMKHTPGFIHIGSYTGNQVNNRYIAEPGSGSFTMAKMTGQHALFRTKNMPVSYSHYFKNSASVTDRILLQSYLGFKLGINNEVNQIGLTYHYMQINGINNLLPITWSAFQAINQPQSVLLNWETGTDDNSSHFIIKRSTDGLVFENIGMVAVDQYRNTGNSYEYEDLSPVQGGAFYRISHVDRNTTEQHSDTRFISRNKIENRNVNIYPNPFSGNQIYIEQTLQSAILNIDVINAVGSRVHQIRMDGTSSVLNLPADLPAGSYYLLASDGKQVVFRKKITKIR